MPQSVHSTLIVCGGQCKGACSCKWVGSCFDLA